MRIVQTLGMALAILAGTMPTWAQDTATMLLRQGDTQTTVRVEIVDEETERARGLMHRTHLCDACGMVFLYPEWQGQTPPPFGMWMRNTLIPLDMLFLKDGTVIGIHEGAVPHDETVIPVPEGTNGVLEVNAGWVKRHGIAQGWTATLQQTPE